MREAYIVDAIRTPIGKFAGGLSSVRPDDLAAHVIAELVKRNSKLDSNTIEDVIFGCANQAGEDNRNVARMSLLLAGLPTQIAGETINRLCASGLSAVVHAARAIQGQAGEVFIAGGVESMSRAPYVLSKSADAFGRDAQLYDTSIGWRFINKKLDQEYGTDSMGQTAENVAEKFNISREDQDAFAYHSQMKCKQATEAGRFKAEIAPVSIPQRKGNPLIIDADEFPRPETSLQALSSLKPAFKKEGSVTAGNASGINDGACALLLCSEEGLKTSGLKPRARFVTAAVAGVEPRLMGIGPVTAVQKALARSGLSLSQMDVIELNEAFAAQSLACLRELGIEDKDQRVNPNGGAIAIGHPLGMSGARLVQTALLELELRGGRYALCTMCVGVGQGMACIIERVA